MQTVEDPSERQERVLSQLSRLRHSYEAGEVPPSWVVLSACTTLESAASEKLQSLLAERAAKDGDSLLNRMIREQRADMDRSWPSRLKWLADGFGVQLADVDHADLIALVDLRNAIAHHSDKFTRRQISNYTTFLNMRHLLEANFSLHTRGIQFTVTPETAEATLRVARRVAIDLLE